jgi:hypothetical protein
MHLESVALQARDGHPQMVKVPARKDVMSRGGVFLGMFANALSSHLADRAKEGPLARRNRGHGASTEQHRYTARPLR